MSNSRISPNLVKSWIWVPTRGRIAKMVVMAELKMDTPMKEIAAMTRFTLTGRAAAICNEGLERD